MSKIIGRFFFKQTTNGNLIGEFSNNSSTKNSTESSDLLTPKNTFVGEYNSTWQDNGTAFFAKLFIEHKANSTEIYSLEWKRDNKIIFWGEGFICDGILIGDYRNFNPIS